MMRGIMHVTTVPMTLGFFRGQVGYLKQRGFSVTVVSSPGALLDRFVEDEQVPGVPLPMARRVAPLADVLAFCRLLRAVARHKPHIVHSTTPKAALLGTLAARVSGRKAVLSVFGLPQMTMTGVGRVLLDANTRLQCALAHRVWCDSESMRRVLVERKLCRAGKIVVLGHGSVNGVDAEARFNPAQFTPAERRALRCRWQIPEDAIVLGFVGRIVRDKGIHELAHAWRMVRDRWPRLHLVIVGECESGDPIDPAVERSLRGDARVHFTGPQFDVSPLFAVMDVFVMPSYREGFGVTNIEAAAFALPVVSTAIPGCIDSVANGVTGTLVPPRDAAALAGAIAHYVEDSRLREQHGAAGRRRVLEQFVPVRIWAELAELYESLLRRTA